MNKIDPAMARAVRLRAKGRCEYCGFAEDVAELRFQIDHVMALQHDGPTESENLALACGFCNRRKGPNLSGVDPETRAVVLLFNPRSDLWADHFQRVGLQIVGRTPVGRATVALLQINARDQLHRRAAAREPFSKPT